MQRLRPNRAAAANHAAAALACFSALTLRMATLNDDLRHHFSTPTHLCLIDVMHWLRVFAWLLHICLCCRPEDFLSPPVSVPFSPLRRLPP